MNPNPFDDRPSYVQAAEKLGALYLTLNLFCEIRRLGEQEDASDTTFGRPWKHKAYTYKFGSNMRTGRNQDQTFDWRQGMGCKKEAMPSEVLARCCADYTSTDRRTFEDWAGELGYDTDSRKSEKVFRTCQELGSQLRALGLSWTQIEKLADLANEL